MCEQGIVQEERTDERGGPFVDGPRCARFRTAIRQGRDKVTGPRRQPRPHIRQRKAALGNRSITLAGWSCPVQETTDAPRSTTILPPILGSILVVCSFTLCPSLALAQAAPAPAPPPPAREGSGGVCLYRFNRQLLDGDDWPRRGSDRATPRSGLFATKLRSYATSPTPR